ncbi:MAG TPA: multifunctional CCA addition/repair protein [Legionellaceae bacterium]|nr:multifunctional CCA addition/repair protein [Legionellaceae bacterium]
MKIYLVGGAVRDQLLGLPIKERDWVVVGAQAQEMLALGYRQVGRDFPVFLHPNTQEEYALARTERKSGLGYYGFECNSQANVTLEEDLLRRDLTINAMAMDDKGHVIDPYQGQKDIQMKVLRHVSDAFVEDPLRVLRVARFMARFQALGFKIAPETQVLMQKMVRTGELNHLVAERVWQEWHQSLLEKNPAAFITTLRACGALPILFPEIHALFGVPNGCKQHPEIDTGVHTLMALETATMLSTDPMIRFATLLHDLGKAHTPMQYWPSQRDHDELGLPIIQALCKRLSIPKRFQQLALMAAQWHLYIHRLKELSAEKILEVLEGTHAFRDAKMFEQLLLVCEADFKGRGRTSDKETNKDYPPMQGWRIILAKSRQLNASQWVEQGLVGSAIKTALSKARLQCIQAIQYGN